MNMKENKANCHPELDSGSRRSIKGFTLIELLVVVLIVAVLAAIAVPQYQKAVLKSRFSSLMPTTQAIRDGQEMYYMTNNKYADEIAELDVKTADTDDMSIDVGDETETPELSYVIASRPNINNNLIMYQKHSEKFADNVHCEALKDNAHAQWLCKDALHGQPIDGSINAEYDTYVLSGTLGENDYFAKECEGSGEQACECGSIQGTCNDKTGNWEYDGECQNRPPSSQKCSNGRQVRSVSCGTNGWTAGDWSSCASEATVTAYEEIQKYNEFFEQIRAAQDEYYQQHDNQYAVDLAALNISFPEGCQKITGSGIYGNWLKCGTDLFIDSSLGANRTPDGFLMIEYCPNRNSGYNSCAPVRDAIVFVPFDHVNSSRITAAYRDRIAPGAVWCEVQHNSSLGQELCSTFY